MRPWKYIERHDNEVISLLTRILDTLAMLCAGYLAFVVRTWPVPVDQGTYSIATVLGALLTIIIFPLAGVYRTQRGQSWFSQFQKILFAWMSVFLLLITIAFVTKTSTVYSRIWVFSWAATSLVLLITFRLLLMKMLSYTRSKGWNRKKIIIIGTGSLGKSVLQRIRTTAWSGMDVIAFINHENDQTITDIEGIQVLPTVNDVLEVADRLRPDELWIAIPLDATEVLEKILHNLRHSTITIRYIPNVLNYRLMNHSVSEIAGLPVVNLTETPLYGINQVLKLLEDRIIAFFILVLCSPLLLLISIAIKIGSPGPIIYRQERVSWNGKRFMMLKFRTMPVDVENASGPVWSKAGENRATRLGSLLRKTSLDELPQFINVLKGDMSIVGPRPERPFFVEQFKDKIPSYMQKHIVKAGITGWAQINGWRGDTDLAKRIEYDLYYIENWSLWFDIKIILATIIKGFIHKNAY
jgi:putative colanic acid biosynthesis UDP-glucose lipid carrier transferase